jgi:peptidoglycan/LPS O-acetylase OafA/YrhL
MDGLSPSAPRNRQSEHHIASLDGVRGVAISMVLLLHLLWANPHTGSRLMDLFSQIRSIGWIGVDLFFALSGFLITGILFDTLNSGHYFKNFYARRFLRIVPLYYGVIFVLFAVLRPPTLAQARPLFVLLAYLQNVPIAWNTGNPPFTIELTNHLWSLAVEEQFYLVWPVIIFLIRDRRKLLWASVILASFAPITRAIMLAHGASFGLTYTMTICRADSLLSGAWLALIIRGNLRATVLRLAKPVFALAVFACAVIAWRSGGFDWETSPAINLYGYSLVAIASTAFIAMSLVNKSVTASAMRYRPLRFLGKYSYGIYVYHHIVNVCLSVTVAVSLHAHIQSRVLYHLVLLAIELAIILPLAWLSFNFYERPFLKLKKYFNYGPAPQNRMRPLASATSADLPG